MSYCHKCGKHNSDEGSFCGSCGTKIKEFIEHTEHSIEKRVKKSKKGLVILIVLILIIGYVILDLWAASQLKPIMSVDSLLSSISNFDGDAGITSASASTTIRIENPTFVPVIIGRVVYDAGYGSTKVAEGKTGMIMVSPYSTQDLPADVKVSYANAGVAGLKALKNLFSGGNDKLNANVYADFGITKFQIARYEQ